MKKSEIQQVIKIIILVFFLVSIQKNVLFLNEHYKTVSIRLEKDPVTIEKIKKINQDLAEAENTTIHELVLWNTEKNIAIENPVLERECMVSKIGVYGSMQATIPMELVAGNYVYQQDKNGCVIDKNTAYRLFGTIDIIGNEIKIEKNFYLIRGVVDTKQMVFLFQNQDQKDLFYNMEIVFSKINWEEGLQKAKALLYQYNLGTNAVFLDAAIYANTIKHYEAIPYWILYLIMVILILSHFKSCIKKNATCECKADKKKYVRVWFLITICMMILIGYGILLLCYFENPCYLPQQWTPTKWSDFNFWVKTAQDIKENFMSIRYIMPNVKDVLLIQKLKETLFEIVISSILIINIMYYFYIVKIVKEDSHV